MSNASNSNRLFRKPFESSPQHTPSRPLEVQNGTSPAAGNGVNDGATENIAAVPPTPKLGGPFTPGPQSPYPPAGSGTAFGPAPMAGNGFGPAPSPRPPASGQLPGPPSSPANGAGFAPPVARSASGQLYPPMGGPNFGPPPKSAPLSGPLAPGMRGPMNGPVAGPPLSGPLTPNLQGSGFQHGPNPAQRPPFAGPHPAQHMFGPTNNNWQQAQAHKNNQKKRRQRVKFKDRSPMGKFLFVIMLLGICVPVISLIVEGISAYSMYSQARDGISHLTAIKTLFSGSSGHLDRYFDVAKLTQAQNDINLAHNDFVQLRDKADQDAFLTTASSLAPQQINSIRALTHIGVDATVIGQQLMQSAINLAPQMSVALKDPLIGTSTHPLITQQTLNEASKDINLMLPPLRDINKYAQGLSLDGLPISESQKQLVEGLLPIIPEAVTALPQLNNLMPALSWMLGVDAPRDFLAQTMDRGELRPTGGFTGQFGDLALNAGRMSQFNLQNIGPYEEDTPGTKTPEEQQAFSKVVGNTAPAPYTWWPIPNFGLRDSNVSVDFPTSAKIAMSLYNLEFGKQADGVILISPFAIANVLQITGPITIPAYNETITSQNLEAKLHYYQLDNNGIYKEQVVENVQDSQIARKLFTKRFSQTLIDHVAHAPLHEILAIANEMLHSMKTKDLQIYVTNPQIEALIAKYGSTNEIDRSSDHDGLYVVQANVSVSKASQYVRTNIADSVTLDAQGGATHTMTMRLDYTQIGPVYGLDTYYDYMRIYVPPSSQFISGNGFTQVGDAYCGGAYRACASDVYGDGTMICPPGADIGQIPAYNNSYTYYDEAIDKSGPPTNTTSDEAGRAMFGGWIVLPKNCSRSITLSWYVPPTGHPYSLLVQRQSDTFPIVDLTIQPTPGSCSTLKIGGLHYSGVMGGEDMTFTPPPLTGQQSTNCYPQPKV